MFLDCFDAYAGKHHRTVVIFVPKEKQCVYEKFFRDSKDFRELKNDLADVLCSTISR